MKNKSARVSKDTVMECAPLLAELALIADTQGLEAAESFARRAAMDQLLKEDKRGHRTTATDILLKWLAVSSFLLAGKTKGNANG